MSSFTIRDSYRMWSEFTNDCEHDPKLVGKGHIHLTYHDAGGEYVRLKIITARLVCTKCYQFSYRDRSFEAKDLVDVEGM